MATEIIRTQKAEKANPTPPMVEDKHRMIEAGELQRALKRNQTEVEDKPRLLAGQHVSEAPTNSNLSGGSWPC